MPLGLLPRRPPQGSTALTTSSTRAIVSMQGNPTFPSPKIAPRSCRKDRRNGNGADTDMSKRHWPQHNSDGPMPMRSSWRDWRMCCNFETATGPPTGRKRDGEVSGCQIEQLVDEAVLLAKIGATDPARLALADHVYRLISCKRRRAASNARKPCLAFTRRLIARWSCSRMLFKYWTGRWRLRRTRVPSAFIPIIAEP